MFRMRGATLPLWYVKTGRTSPFTAEEGGLSGFLDFLSEGLLFEARTERSLSCVIFHYLLTQCKLNQSCFLPYASNSLFAIV